jgi:hypothetical protein
MLFDRFPLPATRAERRTFAQRLLRLAEKRRHVFAAIPAPARWQGLKRRLLGAFRVDVAAGRGLLAAKSVDQAKAVVASVDFDELRSLDRKLDNVGATACVADRQS